MLLGACHQSRSSPQKQVPSPSRHAVGDQVTLLEVRVGNIWGSGYSVRVFPEEYVVLESRRCPDAKRKSDDDDRNAEGICVLRVDKSQSDKFDAALAPFRRYALPLSSFSLDEAGIKRPDGARCRSNVTDQDLISLVWTGTQGAQIATFYTGCDQQEFAAFYDKLSHVTDSLPTRAILVDR